MSNKEEGITRLLKIMSLLRDPEKGCAWDLKQTFQSIAPHTLEEVYEVIDCIEREDYQHLRDELGDLLFQVVFYAQMGREARLFDFEDICQSISEKLLTRHPHVFPDASIESFGKANALSPEQVESNWEKIKQAERQHKQSEEPGLLDDVPQALPAMLRARKLQGRAATGGFDWDNRSAVLDKLKEELQELEQAMASEDARHIDEEFGDLLFSMVNLSRHLKLNPESSLRAANQKFTTRFALMEKTIREDGLLLQDLDLSKLEEYWQKAKRELA
jgi:ATP diphosphatase